MTARGSAHRSRTPAAHAQEFPLSAEDLSILALENGTVVGHTGKVIVLDGELSAAELRASIASRVAATSELRRRLVDGAAGPSWVIGSLDLEDHVRAHTSPAPLDDAALRGSVATLFAQRLDRTRPLWRMDILPALNDGRSAVVWRMHHALADGETCARLACEVLWDTAPQPESGPAHAVPPAAPVAAPRIRDRAAHARVLLREAPHVWNGSPFDGRIGARRSVAFATADLDGLHRAAKATHGATVNDALLSVVAGGLRHWLEERHGHLGSVRVKVPVSLHGLPEPGEPGQAGNRDSFFCVDLPLGPGGPLERLEAIRRATRSRKDGHDAERIDALMRDLGRASPRLRQFAERVLAHPRSFAVNVSNVRGPRRPVTLLGRPVRSLHSVAEIRPRHALRIAVMSLANAVSFGLCADPTLLEGVDRLAAHMEEEAASLVASAACAP